MDPTLRCGQLVRLPNANKEARGPCSSKPQPRLASATQPRRRDVTPLHHSPKANLPSICRVFIMLLLLAIFFAHKAASSSVDTLGYYSAPNFRGTWDLLVGCVLTLTVCVWSALHLNVPIESSLTRRNLRRIRWILLGLFAPELVVSSAFAQYLTARWLRREILADVKYRKAEVCHLCSGKNRLIIGNISLTTIGC